MLTEYRSREHFAPARGRTGSCILSFPFVSHSIVRDPLFGTHQTRATVTVVVGRAALQGCHLMPCANASFDDGCRLNCCMQASHGPMEAFSHIM